MNNTVPTTKQTSYFLPLTLVGVMLAGALSFGLALIGMWAIPGLLGLIIASAIPILIYLLTFDYARKSELFDRLNDQSRKSLENLSTTDWLNSNFSEDDFAQANLDGVKISGHNLKKANLGHAKLTHARAMSTNFEGSCLTAIEAQESNFEGANFRKSKAQLADFSHSDLTNADFRSSQLKGANFEDANLCGADLRRSDHRDVNWMNAKFNRKTRLPFSKRVALEKGMDFVA